MLIGINPLLNADVLHALRAMGHGDVLIVADANFPAETIAVETTLGHLLRIDASTPEVVEAVLELMPLDSFVDDPVRAMAVVGAPDEIPEVRAEVAENLRGRGVSSEIGAIERHRFYDEARGAFAVIQTAERRFYGCISLRKGVIAPDG